MSTFTHERLDVYRVALDFLVLADQHPAALPRGRAYLADQLRRASLSIVLNIAEGAGEFAAPDKARFYRMARRSGNECAAILDAGRALRLFNETDPQAGRTLLDRIVAMLTAMVRPKTGADADADADSERCDQSINRESPPQRAGGVHRISLTRRPARSARCRSSDRSSPRWRSSARRKCSATLRVWRGVHRTSRARRSIPPLHSSGPIR